MKNQTVEFIESKGKFGMKLGLESIRRLLDKLDNPQNKLKYIHVAGSNGKGSISRILESVLTYNHLNTGLYSSPHLEKFNERIRVNKSNISDKDIDRLFKKVKKACDELETEGYSYPTGFEIETAIAFLYFLEQDVDLVILEVGLGGRLDATNIIKDSLISIISSISLEHTQWLGDSLEEIALEKSAIIKKGSNVIISPQAENISDIIVQDANKRGANSIAKLNEEQILSLSSNLNGQSFLAQYSLWKLPLLGSYQKNNLLTALAALYLLKVNGYRIFDIQSGLNQLEFPGRFELIHKNPDIILDGAHNPDGLNYFVESIKNYFGSEKINLFFGILKDKNVQESLQIILPIVKNLYLLRPNNPDALDPEELKKQVRKLDSKINIKVIENYQDILKYIDLSEPQEIYAITGSLYLIGAVRPILIEALKE